MFSIFSERLPKPTTQVEEALYLLIKKGRMTRADFFTETFILNAPMTVLKLRRKGVNIVTDEIKKVNKFGRNIEYGSYRLLDKKEAIKIYKKLQKK